MNYFIQLDEEIHGPLTFDELKRRFSNGNLKEYDLVRREDQRDWKPMSALQELHDSIEIGPPLRNPWAMVSFALALSALLLMGLYGVLKAPWFYISSMLAVICGHLAVSKIRQTAQEVKGYRLAKISLWIGYLVTFIPILSMVLAPFLSRRATIASISQGMGNCRQIITCLKIYAADHDGAYPDNFANVQTSNDAFRRLFGPDIIEEEKIFGCPQSPFAPDGKIGQAPDYLQALEAGENHWAMTAGLNDHMNHDVSLIFENPIEASWPPKWAMSGKEKTDIKPGRTWKGGRMIVGINDGSVVLVTQRTTRNDDEPRFFTDGRNAIFYHPNKMFKVLNVAK